MFQFRRGRFFVTNLVVANVILYAVLHTVGSLFGNPENHQRRIWSDLANYNKAWLLKDIIFFLFLFLCFVLSVLFYHAVYQIMNLTVLFVSAIPFPLKCPPPHLSRQVESAALSGDWTVSIYYLPVGRPCSKRVLFCLPCGSQCIHNVSTYSLNKVYLFTVAPFQQSLDEDIDGRCGLLMVFNHLL